jgi:hypothetical protein
VPVAVTGSNPSLVPKQIAEIAERGVGAGARPASGRLRQAGWSIGRGFIALVVVAVAVSGAAGAILFRP